MPTAKRAVVRDVIEAVELSPAELQIEKAAKERQEDSPLDEPIFYNNPYCVHERFRIPGTSHFSRFAAGGFECKTKLQNQVVRSILNAYGRGKADRWMGRDREKPWVCKKCGFIGFNENAIDDHREYGI